MQLSSIHPSIFYTWLTMQGHMGLDSIMHLGKGEVVLDKTHMLHSGSPQYTSRISQILVSQLPISMRKEL